MAAIEQAVEDGFDRQVQDLAWALTTFLLWQGLWHDKIIVQSAGLCAARRLADPRGQATIHRRLAHAYEMLGDRDDAHSHLQQSLTLCREIGDDHGVARTHLVLAWLSDQEGRYPEGLRHARQSLEAAGAAGNQLMLALARNAVGWCHTLLGEHEQAIAHCEQALAELADLGERGAGMADAWDSLGHAHHQLGQHQQAIDYYRQAVDRCRKVGDRRHEGTILQHLGETYHTIGEDDAARGVWQRALEIYDEIGHPEADLLRKRLE